MTNKINIALLCSLFTILLFSCKKDANCVCTYTEHNNITNITTTNTYSRTIHERQSAQSKACESANFAGTNKVYDYTYETKCQLQ